MKILKVTLKQHTPLIHFQHGEEGATLRASEVKPKLDKYIIEQIGQGPYEEVKNNVKRDYKDWFIDKKNIYALKYKMSIDPGSIPNNLQRPDIEGYFGYNKKQKPNPAPMFFGNMKNKNEPKETFLKKGFSISNNLSLTIICQSEELFGAITKYIYNFFIETNFGTKQSKGYGSFSIDSKEWKTYLSSKGITWKSSIQHPYFTTKGDHKTLFTEMEWFYKAIRSGINDCFGEKFYMKSLMFAYAKTKGEQWEKKTIKSVFYDLISQEDDFAEKVNDAEIRRHPQDNDILTFTSDNEGAYLFKECLGLSTIEQWKKPVIDENGFLKYEDTFILNKSSTKSTKTPGSIQRMKSPVLLKPIKEDNDTYKVYIIRFPLPNHYLGKKLFLNVDCCQNEGFLPLTIYPDFSIDDYFDFLFKRDDKKGTYKINIERLITTGKKTYKAQRVIKIFNELRNTYNKRELL